MRVVDVFAGVGGFALALDRLGFEHVAMVEWNARAADVLRLRFPGVPVFGDVKALRAADLPRFDVLAGSPPCQSASCAGQRKGDADDRWLWPEFLRLAEESRPVMVLAENVPGLLTLGGGRAFGGILRRLHEAGYAVEWDCCPALATGAPHRRDRLWVVARRDGLTTWESRCAQPSFMSCEPASWPRAGRWDGSLEEREPRWPVPQVEAAWRERWEGANSWPTARTGEAKQGDGSPAKRATAGSEDRMLSDAARMVPWATASSRDWKSGDVSAETIEGNARPLNEQVKIVTLPDGKQVGILPGALNPQWVESLVGLPIGWTDLACEHPVKPPDWPMPRAVLADGTELWGLSPQHEWEPPRRVIGRDKQRRHRLAECGNVVVNQCAALALEAVSQSSAMAGGCEVTDHAGDGWHILVGDALERLRELPDESVHCCVTSPPYWGLRDYGCEAQIGLEETPERYVENLVRVFAEVRRVLRPDGTVWLNLGDSYGRGAETNVPQTKNPRVGFPSHAKAGSSDGAVVRAERPGSRAGAVKPKDLVGIPWRVAFALQADGWWLRSDIIWSKRAPMPESVRDRPTRAHEYMFLLAKSERYYFDADAVSEPSAYPDDNRKARTYPTRNIRTVWTLGPEPFADAHFAVMPTKLVEPCVKAGTSERGRCTECGESIRRVVERISGVAPLRCHGTNIQGPASRLNSGTAEQYHANRDRLITSGWGLSCGHAGDPAPCVVLDPFSGAGTVGVVARRLGREFVGVELNPQYAAMAAKRIAHEWREEPRQAAGLDGPLFAEMLP